MPVVPAAERISRYEGDPWAQQPGESARQFARFTQYLTMPRGERSIPDVARAHHLTDSTLREVAERWRWRERSDLYDADRDRADLAQIAGKESMLRVRTINLALVTASIMGRSLRRIADDPNTVIDAKDLPQWAKMTETLRKIAIDAPDQLVHIMAGASDPSSVDIPDFTGLSEAQMRDRAGEMARSVLRVLDGGKAG